MRGRLLHIFSFLYLWNCSFPTGSTAEISDILKKLEKFEVFSHEGDIFSYLVSYISEIPVFLREALPKFQTFREVRINMRFCLENRLLLILSTVYF